MVELLGKVLPLALGAAISPMLLTIVVFVLASGRKSILRVWIFALGCLSVLLLVTLVGQRLYAVAKPHTGVDVGGGIIKSVAAAALVLLAYRAMANRHTTSNGLLTKLGSAKTWEFYPLGVLSMLSNFSSIVLFIPAIHEIFKSTEPDPDKVAVYVILVVITLIPVWLPGLAATLLGPRATPALDRLNTLVSAHAAQINMAICLLFAVYLAVGAYKDFTG